MSKVLQSLNPDQVDFLFCGQCQQKETRGMWHPLPFSDLISLLWSNINMSLCCSFRHLSSHTLSTLWANSLQKSRICALVHCLLIMDGLSPIWRASSPAQPQLVLLLARLANRTTRTHLQPIQGHVPESIKKCETSVIYKKKTCFCMQRRTAYHDLQSVRVHKSPLVPSNGLLQNQVRK